MNSVYRIIFLIAFVFCFCKADYGQNFIWARQIDVYSHNINPQSKIVTDNSGNSYVTSVFTDSVRFGATAFYTSGSNKSYLVKYDPMGNVVWAVANSGVSSSMCIDPNNNVYVSGYFQGVGTFGPYIFTSDIGIFSTFLIKYNSSGNLQWAKIFYANFSTVSNISISTLVCDQTGDIILSGRLQGTVTIDTFALNEATERTFVSKLDTSGNVMWLKKIKGSSQQTFPEQLNTDASNNIIVAGTFGNSMTGLPGYTSIFDGDTLFNDGYTDIFFVKYDSNGNVIWAKKISSSFFDWTNGLTTDAAMNHYLLGSVGGIPFLTKFDSAGNQIWNQAANNGVSWYGMTGNLNGDCYFTAAFNDTLLFDTLALYTNIYEYHLLKIDSSGNVHWNKKISTPTIYINASLSGNRNGNLFLSGSKYYGRFRLTFDQCQLYKGVQPFDFVAVLHDTDFTPQANNIISGNIFDDDNLNCSHDAGEIFLNSFSVAALPGPFFATTDYMGNYNLKVDTGSFSVHEIIPYSHGYLFSQNCPIGNSYSGSLPLTNTYLTGYDFADSYSACHLLDVSLGTTEHFIFCSATKQTELYVCNYGQDTAFNLQLIVQYPGRMTPISSNIPWTNYNTFDSLMTFTFSYLLPDSCIHILITDSLDCSSLTMNEYMSYPYTYSAYLTPLNSCYTNDSIYNYDSKTEWYFIPISTQDDFSTKEINVYPNPVHDELFVNLKQNSGNIFYSVYDIAGKIVAENMLMYSGRQSINVSSLSPGFYLLRIIDGKNISHTKFVKD